LGQIKVYRVRETRHSLRDERVGGVVLQFSRLPAEARGGEPVHVHGGPLGAPEVNLVKVLEGFLPGARVVADLNPDELVSFFQVCNTRGNKHSNHWNDSFDISEK
jgi:hypothetical protein